MPQCPWETWWNMVAFWTQRLRKVYKAVPYKASPPCALPQSGPRLTFLIFLTHRNETCATLDPCSTAAFMPLLFALSDLSADESGCQWWWELISASVELSKFLSLIRKWTLSDLAPCPSTLQTKLFGDLPKGTEAARIGEWPERHRETKAKFRPQ